MGRKRKPPNTVETCPAGFASVALGGGMYGLIDCKDIPLLQNLRWFAKRERGQVYMVANERKTGRSQLRFHRLVIPCKGAIVDHINRNGLDNRRVNLRVVDCGTNYQNSPPRGLRRYRGLTLAGGKWRARVSRAGRRAECGLYTTQVRAGLAYDYGADLLYGPLGFRNFPAIVAIRCVGEWVRHLVRPGYRGFRDPPRFGPAPSEREGRLAFKRQDHSQAQLYDMLGKSERLARSLRVVGLYRPAAPDSPAEGWPKKVSGPRCPSCGIWDGPSQGAYVSLPGEQMCPICGRRYFLTLEQCGPGYGGRAEPALKELAAWLHTT
jgi:hypothetical protein